MTRCMLASLIERELLTQEVVARAMTAFRAELDKRDQIANLSGGEKQDGGTSGRPGRAGVGA